MIAALFMFYFSRQKSCLFNSSLVHQKVPDNVFFLFLNLSRFSNLYISHSPFDLFLLLSLSYPISVFLLILSLFFLYFILLSPSLSQSFTHNFAQCRILHLFFDLSSLSVFFVFHFTSLAMKYVFFLSSSPSLSPSFFILPFLKSISFFLWCLVISLYISLS